MARAYIRLDPAFAERKATYPDGPHAALTDTFCLAELQPERGRFRSPRYLASLLDKRGRHVQYLVDHGDLVLLDDGRVYVDGWDEWQEGDWKVGERVARVRSRQRNGGVTVPVTVGVTVPNVPPHRLDLSDSAGAGGALTKPSADGDQRPPDTRAVGIDHQRDGLPHLTPKAQAAILSTAGQVTFAGASDKVLTDLDGLLERHGLAAVDDALASVKAGGAQSWPQLVYRTRNHLEPIAEERVSPQERKRREHDEALAEIREGYARAQQR